jgi:hypothetical protein
MQPRRTDAWKAFLDSLGFISRQLSHVGLLEKGIRCFGLLQRNIYFVVAIN